MFVWLVVFIELVLFMEAVLSIAFFFGYTPLFISTIEFIPLCLFRKSLLRHMALNLTSQMSTLHIYQMTRQI